MCGCASSGIWKLLSIYHIHIHTLVHYTQYVHFYLKINSQYPFIITFKYKVLLLNYEFLIYKNMVLII